MADEARLVFELIDRSSPGGSRGPAPADGAGSPAAGSTTVQDFQTQANQAGGAGALADGNNPNTAKGPRWRGAPRGAGRGVPPDDAAEPPPVIDADIVGERELRNRVLQVANTAAEAAGMAGPVGSATAGVLQRLATVLPAGAGAAIPAGVAAALPLVGIAAAGFAIPAAGVAALVSAAETARGQARGLSPELAEAEAQANVRQILANMRTARRLGDELSDFTTARSRLSAAVQGVRDIVIEGPLEELNGNLKLLAQAMEALQQAADRFPEATKQAGSDFVRILLNTLFPTFQAGTVFSLTGKLSNWLDKQQSQSLGMLDWFHAQPHLPLPAPFSPTGEAPAAARLSPVPGLEL